MKNRILTRIKRINFSYIVKAFILNTLVLILLFLFFKPVEKSDDYYLGEIAYGAFSGKYDVHLVYNNIILGYLIKGLMILFPNVAWYTVLQVIFIFCAFSILTYYLLKMKTERNIRLLIYFFLGWFGYECYIKITFTKTAAVLVATGVFMLFKAIENRNKIWIYIVGFAEIFVGILYRRAIVSSVLGIMIGICLIDLIKQRKKHRVLCKRVIIYLTSILIILGVSKLAANLNGYLYSLEEGWNQYYHLNYLKGAIVDYTSNNYDTNAEEYSAIGVSENDLAMIYNNDLYDFDYLSEDLVNKIISIAQTEKQSGEIKEIFKFQNIQDFFKTVPIAYIRLASFGCFILVSLYFFMYGPKYKIRYWLYVIAVILAENYYLFLLGRVLQPYIDFGIIYAASLFLLFFMDQDTKYEVQLRRKNSVTVTVLLVLGFFILNGLNEITAPYFYNYGSENACNPKKSKEIMDVITEDKSHLYITPSRESVFTRWGFDTFEVIPKGYFSNVFSMGNYILPSQKKALDNFCVENPLKEISNADNMYFLVSDDLETDAVNTFSTYVTEHYDKNAEMVKVKKIGTANIYRCLSGKLTLKDYPLGEKTVNSNVTYRIEDGKIIVEGYGFVEDSNSYNQDVYLKIVDRKTNTEKLYTAMQTENYNFTNNMNGRYSSINASITIPQFWYGGADISLVIIDNDQIYNIPIRKS